MRTHNVGSHQRQQGLLLRKLKPNLCLLHRHLISCRRRALHSRCGAVICNHTSGSKVGSDQLSRREAISLLCATTAASVAPRRVLAAPEGDGGSALDKRVSEFNLSNGLHFIVLERHNAPIVSCHTYANVGAFDEQDGQTGISHLLEHMAFKGSDRIGTKNFAQEAPLLDAMDEVFYSLREARIRGAAGELARLTQQLRQLEAEAAAYSIPNDFGIRLERVGAKGLNASTSQDATRYVTSLPVNALELWFSLESERFQAPVFRELYSEKRVVLEERRARVDNSPLGKYQENFNAAALANNYSRPVIGHVHDVEAIGRRELQNYFSRFYGPSNLTIAIVGDVNPDKVHQLAEKYFGGWQPSNLIPGVPAPKPGQEPSAQPTSGLGPFEQAATAGPALMKAFYREGMNSQDAVVLEVISEVLTGGRTSRLERQLVQSGKAYSTNVLTGFPGDKHPCATMVYAIPSATTTLADLEGDVMREVTALASNGVTPGELQRIKKAAKLELVEGICYNSSMAATLCSYHALTGDWHSVLRELDTVEQLTSDQIRDVAQRTFREENSFTGWVLPKGPISVPQQPVPVVLGP